MSIGIALIDFNIPSSWHNISYKILAKIG